MSVDPFTHFFILLGGLLGLTLGVAHGIRNTAFRWSRLLGWALATHALSDVYLWLYWTKTPVDFRVLRLVPLNVVLIPVYLLFQYIRSFAGAGQYGRQYGHFLAVTAILELIIYLLPAGAALFTGSINDSVLSFSKSIRNALTLGSLPIVIAACGILYRVIQHYKSSVERSTTSNKQTGWLNQLLVGLCIVYGLAQLPIFTLLIDGWQSRRLFYPLGIGSSLFLTWAGIRGFIIHERLSHNDAAPGRTMETYSAQANLYQQMTQLIQQEQLYKLPNLRLADVANRLSVSPHHLSRTLNQQAKKNFTDMINEFRVIEVKRLMHDPAFRKYTLEGLGREAGFGAKSTYQASFKRITGQTPSQYRDGERPAC